MNDDMMDIPQEMLINRVNSQEKTINNMEEALWKMEGSVERLRWQLTHSIYCPVKTCNICADIEKEVSNGFQPVHEPNLQEIKERIREYNISKNWYSKNKDKNLTTPEEFIKHLEEEGN